MKLLGVSLYLPMHKCSFCFVKVIKLMLVRCVCIYLLNFNLIICRLFIFVHIYEVSIF